MKKKIKDLTEEELETLLIKYHYSGKYNCSDCPFGDICGYPRTWLRERN